MNKLTFKDEYERWQLYQNINNRKHQIRMQLQQLQNELDALLELQAAIGETAPKFDSKVPHSVRDIQDAIAAIKGATV